MRKTGILSFSVYLCWPRRKLFIQFTWILFFKYFYCLPPPPLQKKSFWQCQNADVTKTKLSRKVFHHELSYILSLNIYSIMSFSTNLNHHLLSFSSGATIEWTILSHWKKYKEKYHFLQERKFVKNVCN